MPRNIRITLLSTAVLALAITSVAHASEMDDISQKLKSGDYSVVKTQLIPLAESGDARAQFNLGVSYNYGNGVEKDVGKAFEWTKKSAQNGDVHGQVNLANMYMQGQGTDKSIPEAINWYEKAATQDDIHAEVVLGKIYRDGLTGKVDYSKSFQYFSKAAEHGDHEAEFNLAGFYHYGFGVQKDEERAKSLLAEANSGQSNNQPNKPHATLAAYSNNQDQ